MVKLLVLTCILGVVTVEASRLRRETPANSTGQAPSSTPAVPGSAASSLERVAKSKEGSASPKDAWYWKEMKIEDVEGCNWPYGFQERFSFCANRSSIDSLFSVGASDGAEFGVLDKEIATEFLEKCSRGDCSKAKINRTQLIDRAELWWHHMDNITEFGTCLKKNSEGMVRLCGSSDNLNPLSQIVSGIGGLHLNIIEVLSIMHKHVKEHENGTEACLAKLSEAVHFTAATYLSGHFYAENKVQCWDVTRNDCSNPLCKQFVHILSCLQSVCPISASDLAHSGIWEWHFTDTKRSLGVCKVEIDNAQCQTDSSSVLSKTSDSTIHGYLQKESRELIQKIKDKAEEVVHKVEAYTHMKFYQVSLIALGILAAFIGVVTALCMWYHGLLCHRRKRRVLRYSKLVPEDRSGHREEESKSLTRDYDDVE